MNSRSFGWTITRQGVLVVDGAPVEAVRCAVAALNASDVGRYLTYFHPSCERHIAGFAEPLSVTEVADNLRQLDAAFDGLHLGEELLFGDERFVCARWRLRGRHARDYLGFAPEGRSIDVATCEVYEVEAGLVVSTWVYGDVEDLFRQISQEEHVP